MAAHVTHSASRYRRITELGRGGMATCFLAALEGPGAFQKLVVLKEMRGDLAEDPAFRRMFVDEARVAARLNHSNVVQTFEAFDAGGTFTIVMEFLDGQPLNKVRGAARREVLLPLQLMITSQALAGLEHVHEFGLVHRDVSPQNIFVTYAGEVKLLDFGIAKTTDSSVHTAVGTLKGKLGYMAPEQVLGKRVDRRTDVFAMGVVLWESLTGTRLWANIPEPAILGRLASGLIPSVRSVSPDVPEELDAICARAMQVDPDHRFSSALEFQQALDAFVARMTVTPTRRDLAQLMNSMFAQQRQRLRAVIDATLSGAAAPAAELLPMLAPFQPPPNHSGLTLPPTAVTSTHARGGQPSTTPSHRGTTAGVVIGLAVAAALVFGVAIGATARRPTSKSAATVPSGAPNVPVAAAPLPASAAPTDAPPPLAAEGETVATPPLAPTTSGANVGTKSSGARATRAVPAAAAGGGSASPDRRAPVTRPRPGDVDLGY